MQLGSDRELRMELEVRGLASSKIEYGAGYETTAAPEVWDPNFKADPNRSYERARRTMGDIVPIELAGIGQAWLVIGHAAMRILLHDKRLSKDSGSADARFHERHPSRKTPLFINLLTMDPPRHTALRGILQAEFSNKRVEELRPGICEIADDLLDAIGDETSIELVNRYTRPLPLRVICDILGIPRADEELLGNWSLKLVSTEPGDQEKVRTAARELRDYLLDIVRSGLPQGTIYGQLIDRYKAGEMNEDELVGMGFLLLAAGHETTTSFLSNGVIALLNHGQAWKELSERRLDITAAVDELLRFEGPLETGTPWFASDDIEIGNRRIRAGEMVLFGINAVNRDPIVFSDPETMDFKRTDSRKHLSFLHGIHRCLGARLAQIESEIGLLKLAQRFPDLCLDHSAGPTKWRPGFMRGPITLWVQTGAKNEPRTGKTGISETEMVERFSRDWRAAGIKRGTTVLLHSNCSRHLRFLAKAGLKPDPNIILDSFLDAIGPEGTLLLPFFDFGFARGEPFDIRNTPSKMGILTETARKRKETVRTGHPIYSFGAIGAQSERFAGIENFSGYGEDSPFAILHRLAGQLAALDLRDIEAMTFMHYVEQCEDVPYRYHKDFCGRYTDAKGIETHRVFSLFVRDIENGVETRGEEMGEMLWRNNSYKGFKPREGSGLRTIDAALFYDEIAAVIRSNRALGLLYDINPET